MEERNEKKEERRKKIEKGFTQHQDGQGN